MVENLCSDEEIEHLARSITERGFGLPALIVIEMYKPLAGVFHSGALLASPLLIPLVGFSMFSRLMRLLESRDRQEKLTERIEQLVSKAPHRHVTNL